MLQRFQFVRADLSWWQTPMASPASLLPTPGEIAFVRQRHYLVEETVSPPSAGQSALVRLSCVDDDAQGQPLEVLWDRELDHQVLTGEAWESVASRGFDPPDRFAAYLHTLRWNCVTSTDPKLLQAPFRAGIKLDAYQLEPLRKALLLPRVNLFIADDVGLGKTIEAGLIARELLLRKKVREIVVACPPSMLLQWQDELDSRFGLTFEIIDKNYLQQVRRQRGFGVNPWSTHARFLISHRLLIDEAYAAPLRDWLGSFRPGTLLVLDEAHNAAPASGQRYAIDSQTTRAVRDLAPRFEHRLFLSATPHNGHSNSFSALLEILDPQRFCRGVPVTPKYRDEVIVRRLKEDIREIQGGFPKRTPVQIDLDGLPADAPELQLMELLDDYRELREARLQTATRRQQAAGGLLIIGLQQRLLSSIEAFARTLRVHRKTVLRQWEASQTDPDAAQTKTSTLAPTQLDLLTGGLDSDDDRASLAEEELQAEEDAQVEAATLAALGPISDAEARALFAREQALLDQMTELAESARHLPDARLRRLVAWIRQQMCLDLGQPGARWNDTRVLIFTEYDDTKRYLVEQLEAAVAGSERADQRIAVFHGPTPPARREEIKQAFNAPPARHPLRILVATDAAREGLNLQAHCSNLFHFDVPWNPSRMEQRNGRIDRKLQPREEVFCHYFFYRQRPEDRILQTLVRKTETIRRELGSLSQVVDARLTKSLSRGIRRRELDQLAGEIESADLDLDRRRAIDEELEAARERQQDLRSQIDRLRNQLAVSQAQIGLEESQFRSAISCALEMAGAQPLAADSTEQQGPPRFVFPALNERHGGDPTWADTIDTLRAPRKRDQTFWDWRSTSPLRPVVFEDPGTLDSDVVQLHLEQRVVQRLLGRFTAQGFVLHDLSRACLAHTRDAVPRVALLGRLCLYGAGGARLHEELIPLTARWTDPAIRKSPLAPYARDAEAKTMALLEDGLVQEHARPVADTVQRQLQAGSARDVQELLPHLEARGQEYAADAAKLLSARGEAEARAMREILEAQRKHIADTVAHHQRLSSAQMKLDFGDDEAELAQLEANKRHWAKRLELLEAELAAEPERIRRQYEVLATRLEPVGLVYLWPITG
jgi:superfamily II DNA or RNA helicase